MSVYETIHEILRRLQRLETERHKVVHMPPTSSESAITPGKLPFQPYCSQEEGSDSYNLAIWPGFINATSAGLGVIVPTYNGNTLTPPGPITGPVPSAMGPHWVTIKLTVVMKSGEDAGTDFCKCIDSMTAEILILPANGTSAPGAPAPPANTTSEPGAPAPPADVKPVCGTIDDDDTSNDETTTAVDGELYFSVWQFDYQATAPTASTAPDDEEEEEEEEEEEAGCYIEHGAVQGSNVYICCGDDKITWGFEGGAQTVSVLP